MAKRRRRPFTFREKVRPGRTERIRIPQPPDRPLRLKTRNLVRKDFVSEDPWWFTVHRRGVRRRKVGISPLEARAVPKTQVRGTLPERILYLALIKVLHFTPDADFTFQSSLQGGRLELGGIVADFVFEFMRIIIRVQGPTHTEFLRNRKDEEQRGMLEEMGFRVEDIEDRLIYDEYKLEDWLRRKFGLRGGRGGSGGAFGPHDMDESPGQDVYLLQKIWDGIRLAEAKLDEMWTSIPNIIRKEA